MVPISVTLTERSNNSNTSLLPYDYYSGGQIFTKDGSDVNFQNALLRFNMSFSNQPTFCFIPTPSALDIGLNNVALSNSDYFARYVGGLPPVLQKIHRL